MSCEIKQKSPLLKKYVDAFGQEVGLQYYLEEQVFTKEVGAKRGRVFSYDSKNKLYKKISNYNNKTNYSHTVTFEQVSPTSYKIDKIIINLQPVNQERRRERAEMRAEGDKTFGNIFNQQAPIKEGVDFVFEQNPELANEIYEALVPKGYTRLYRSEDDNTQDKPAPDWVKESEEYKAAEEAKGRWFYKTLNEAIEHSKKFGSKGITYIDISTDQVDSFNAKNNKFAGGYGKDGNEYFVSKELANNRKSFEQQKQQAQQLYSAYLDSIFPDYIDNVAYEAVEEFLVVNKIIDRKC